MLLLFYSFEPMIIHEKKLRLLKKIVKKLETQITSSPDRFYRYIYIKNMYEGGPKSNGLRCQNGLPKKLGCGAERECGNSLFDQVSVRKASPELVCEVLSL